jgi:hypothetical protein
MSTRCFEARGMAFLSFEPRDQNLCGASHGLIPDDLSAQIDGALALFPDLNRAPCVFWNKFSRSLGWCLFAPHRTSPSFSAPFSHHHGVGLSPLSRIPTRFDSATSASPSVCRWTALSFRALFGPSVVSAFCPVALFSIIFEA